MTQKNDYYWKLRVKKEYDPSQPRVPAGSPEGGRWTAGDGGTIGTPAKSIISDAPPILQSIIDKSTLVPTVFSGRIAHAAGTSARKLPDGSYEIRIAAGRRPSPGIVIHEAVHGHQSGMDLTEVDEWQRRFSEAAIQDNKTVKNPLWGNDMLWNGDEIWATAAAFRYGRTPWILEESSPAVNELLKELYGE